MMSNDQAFNIMFINNFRLHKNIKYSNIRPTFIIFLLNVYIDEIKYVYDFIT